VSALVLDVGAFFVEEALAAVRAEELEFFVVAQLLGVRAEFPGAGGTGYPKEFGHKIHPSLSECRSAKARLLSRSALLREGLRQRGTSFH